MAAKASVPLFWEKRGSEAKRSLVLLQSLGCAFVSVVESWNGTFSATRADPHKLVEVEDVRIGWVEVFMFCEVGLRVP